MESIGVGDLEAKIYSSGVERNRQILRPDQIVRFMRMVTSPACRGDRRVLLSAITVIDRPVQTGVLRGTGRPRVCGHGPSVDAAPSGLSSETNLSSAGRTRPAASRTAGRLRHRRPGAVPRWAVTSPGISPSFRCRPLRRWDRTSRRRRARLGPPVMISSPPVVSNNRPYQKPESSEERR